MPPSLLRFMRTSLGQKSKLKPNDACKTMVGCLLSLSQGPVTTDNEEEQEETPEETSLSPRVAGEVCGSVEEESAAERGPRSRETEHSVSTTALSSAPHFPVVSTMVVANIASYMTAPDTAVLAASRYNLEIVNSLGDTLAEGRVLHQPTGTQGRYYGLHTTAGHVWVSTEDGLSAMRLPSSASFSERTETEEKHFHPFSGVATRGAEARGTSFTAPPSTSSTRYTRRRNDEMEVVAELPMPYDSSEQILCFTCTPDGSYLATGNGISNLSVYRCTLHSFPGSIDLLYEFTGHTDNVRHLQFTQHPNPLDFQPEQDAGTVQQQGPSLLLYSSGDDGRICQWDLQKGVLLRCMTYGERWLGVFEVSYWSGRMAIASNKPMLVIHQAAPETENSTSAAIRPARVGLDANLMQLEGGNFVFRRYTLPTTSSSPAHPPAGRSPHTSLYQRSSVSDDTGNSTLDTPSPLWLGASRNALLEAMQGLPLPPASNANNRSNRSENSNRGTGASGGSASPAHVVATQHCPRLHLETITLITGAHKGTLTAAKFTEDSEWVASVGEDEVIAISSVCERPQRLFRCLEGLTRRNCFTLYNVLLSVGVLTGPPRSSVIVVIACASDGTLIQWVVDPRDDRSSYTKKVQLYNLGTLMAVDVQPVPPSIPPMFYF